MTGRTALGSLTDTDRLYVERDGSLEPTTFAALAKAVRETVKVGGRNLVLDSNTLHSGDYGLGKLTLSEPWEPGKSYIMTLWDVTLGEGKQNLVQIWNKGGAVVLFACKEQSDGTFRGTFTPTSSLDITKAGEFNVHVFPKDVKTMSSFGRAKFEEGNIPTAWSPAPEDLESAISGGVICSTLYAPTGQEGGQHERVYGYNSDTFSVGFALARLSVSGGWRVETAAAKESSDCGCGATDSEHRRANRDRAVSIDRQWLGGDGRNESRESRDRENDRAERLLAAGSENGFGELLSAVVPPSGCDDIFPQEVHECVECVESSRILLVTVRRRKEVTYVDC